MCKCDINTSTLRHKPGMKIETLSNFKISQFLTWQQALGAQKTEI